MCIFHTHAPAHKTQYLKNDRGGKNVSLHNLGRENTTDISNYNDHLILLST